MRFNSYFIIFTVSFATLFFLYIFWRFCAFATIYYILFSPFFFFENFFPWFLLLLLLLCIYEEFTFLLYIYILLNSKKEKLNLATKPLTIKVFVRIWHKTWTLIDSSTRRISFFLLLPLFDLFVFLFYQQQFKMFNANVFGWWIQE